MTVIDAGEASTMDRADATGFPATRRSRFVMQTTRVVLGGYEDSHGLGYAATCGNAPPICMDLHSMKAARRSRGKHSYDFGCSG